jgi:hypothetical protein
MDHAVADDAAPDRLLPDAGALPRARGGRHLPARPRRRHPGDGGARRATQ